MESAVSRSNPPRLGAWFRGSNVWVFDAFLAALFLLVSPIALYSSDLTKGVRHPDAFALFLTLSMAVPYFFRRHAPLAVLLVTTVPIILICVRDYPTGTTPMLLMVGLYTVAAYGNQRERLIGALDCLVALVIVAVVGTSELDGPSMAFNFVLFAAAFGFGSSVRNRRLYIEQVEQHTAALERERDEGAKRAVADERLRIAQELHDVVAHSMGVIAVQAGVGAHVIGEQPAEAKRSLEAIAVTSRATLTEIRRLLGVLREDVGAEYEPSPGLRDLDRLVADLVAAGLPVDVVVTGNPDDVPGGVDLTAYRIVQEALTNVLKHAGPARAKVEIAYERGAIALEVSDDGRGVNGRSPEGGHGILGMRERVGVYGGTLSAGPKPGGGFRVRASLPYLVSE